MTTESITWRIPNMDCAAEESEIRRALQDVAGVQRLAFRLGARELRVDAAPGTLPAVASRLRAAGFAPAELGAAAPAPACASAACGPVPLSVGGAHHGHSHDDHDHAAAPAGTGGWRALLYAPGLPRIGAALVLALAAEAVHALAPAGWAAAGMALAVAAVLLAGLSTYLKGVNALRRGRLNISALMAVAVTGALLIGQWPEAAMVMALYALAEHLEARAVDRARGAIGGLLQMAPDTVELRGADGGWSAVPAAQVPVGAVMRVKPGARLALDGVVTAGQSAIDQAPVTGESLPVDKAPGDAVYAGTLNQSGVLEVRVTAAAQDTQLARIIHAVEQAQSERAPTQAFIDRFAAVYTPAVFVLALAVALLGPWLAGWTWAAAIYKALVLLVIACPCALVIATPVTVVSALAHAARRGVLIKGGVYLENARRLKAVALDKTGTLTEGKPVLAAHEVLSKTELPALALPAAAALSAQSDHPVSRAIAQGLTAEGVAAAQVTQFIDRPGSGVEGVVDGQRLRLVSVRALEGSALASAALTARLAAHQAQGRSVSLLASDTEVLALFAVADTLKGHAPEAVRALHALGVTTVMLSGDHAAAAHAVAGAAGVAEAHGQLLPADKLARIAELQARIGPTAMAGDGINDAPALAAADIGIAMGAAGTDTAMEAADVVVMNDDLRRLPGLIRLSRRTHGVLWQNIALALGIKAGFLVLALAGSATMWMAVFADMGASLIVVANGLRLLRGSRG
ncbi:heavy metal translocating P-type ATPase [Ottowia testudinis]|uniref:P-type Zn(2+) transporter n=1 Tax=Ottowia testudinis TaxID=2816950 RepID=A0A975H369_9BURK|nr:heavy metal translocating P-type ATPase [Ottowia testudinis]QTD45588.1 cadmium-translocating P-type ATPase [Ottowia testudinis]